MAKWVLLEEKKDSLTIWEKEEDLACVMWYSKKVARVRPWKSLSTYFTMLTWLDFTTLSTMTGVLIANRLFTMRCQVQSVKGITLLAMEAEEMTKANVFISRSSVTLPSPPTGTWAQNIVTTVTVSSRSIPLPSLKEACQLWTQWLRKPSHWWWRNLAQEQCKVLKEWDSENTVSLIV